jgi:hypothetical protein
MHIDQPQSCHVVSQRVAECTVLPSSEHIAVKALLARVLPDVIIGAELESKVTLMVGSDVQHYGDY